jgi:hypothetical protein
MTLADRRAIAIHRLAQLKTLSERLSSTIFDLEHVHGPVTEVLMHLEQARTALDECCYDVRYEVDRLDALMEAAK